MLMKMAVLQTCMASVLPSLSAALCLMCELLELKSSNFFPNQGSTDTNLSKTSYMIACCSNVGAAVGLSVDQRAGWKPTELRLSTSRFRLADKGSCDQTCYTE